MSLKLPKGTQFGFASLLDTTAAITAVSAANPAVASLATGATAPAEGSVVLLALPGWPAANNRPVVYGEDGALLGLDTTSAKLYRGASGAGTLQVAGDFVDLTQQGDPTTSGGEQQYWQGTLLEDPLGRQISLPTYKNAKTLTIPLYYDASAPWYTAAQEADAVGEPLILRAVLANGDTLYWYGYLSFDKDPTMAANTPMGNTLSFAIIGESTLVEAE